MGLINEKINFIDKTDKKIIQKINILKSVKSIYIEKKIFSNLYFFWIIYLHLFFSNYIFPIVFFQDF